jgi:hypothetical protein
MNDEAESQEIQGTVVSSGRFPEPAADDLRDPAEVTDQADVSDPEDQEDQEDERPDSADPGYGRVAPDRDDEDDDEDDDDDELVDPDAVIIAEVDDEPDDDETPEPVAGFARTPVASSASAVDGDGDGDGDADTSAEDAETAAAVDQDAETAAAVDQDAETAAAVDQDAAEAATVPETDVIAEAARPGVPQVAGVPRDTDVTPVSGMAGDPAQLHERWLEIQSSFVDDPRTSVSAAAELVGEAIAALVAGIQERERALRGDWERDGTDTEDLRNTLRGYRGLLDQIAAR